MTTATYRITHTILEGNLSTNATREDVEQLAQTIADRIADAFPGYEVKVPVMWRTSGAGPSTRVETPDYLEEDRIRERANEIAGAAWEEWIQALPEKE